MIVSVGAANIDLVVEVPRLPVPGETVTGRELVIVPGGKGANQAVAARLAGGNVAFVGKVGQDDFGRQLLETFKQARVSRRYVRRQPGVRSGVALIFVDSRGTNVIAYAPGANACLSPADVEAATGAFRRARVVTVELQIPLETARAALSFGRQAGAVVIFDPAPAVAGAAELVSLADIVTPNETEAAALTGVPVVDIPSARQAARRLLAMGVRRAAIVTLGAKGSVVAVSEGEFHLPALPVQARDTTAAGDAYVGGLAAALALGADLWWALRVANVAAGLSVTRLGAMNSLATRAEIEAALPGPEPVRL